jgi:hypothetical protein
MTHGTIPGTKTPSSGRRPRQKGSVPRLCTEESCDTKLSAYNSNDTCYHHSPRKYPRVRGKITE